MPASMTLKNDRPETAGGLNVEYRHDIRNGIAIEILRNDAGDEAILGYAFLGSDALPDKETARNRFSWILADIGLRDEPSPFIVPEVPRADWQVEAVAALLADHLSIFQDSPVCARCLWSRPTIGKRRVGTGPRGEDVFEYYHTLGCVAGDDDPGCEPLRAAPRNERDFQLRDYNRRCSWKIRPREA